MLAAGRTGLFQNCSEEEYVLEFTLSVVHKMVHLLTACNDVNGSLVYKQKVSKGSFRGFSQSQVSEQSTSVKYRNMFDVIYL